MSVRVSIELVVMTCPNCGVVYGLNETYQERKYKDAGSWWCPNGHSLHYPRESDEKRITRLEAEKIALSTRVDLERNAKLEAQVHRDRALADKQRLKKRIANGVCPCCHRHFVNVERHMKTKHPAEVTR